MEVVVTKLTICRFDLIGGQLVVSRVLICTKFHIQMLVYIQTSKQTFKSFHIGYKVSYSAVAITSCRLGANIICFIWELSKVVVASKYILESHSLQL